MNVCRSLTLGVLLGAAACTGGSGSSVDPSPAPGPTGQVNASLSSLLPMRCEDVEGYLRSRAIFAMNQMIDAQLEELGKSSYAACGYGYGSSEDASYGGGSSGTSGATSSSGGSSSGGSSGSSSGGSGSASSSKGATQTSKTNNQVANVDEADFVKNDDKFIYAAVNGTFQIVQAYPGNEAREVARIPLEGEPRKLFVDGDRAVVYVAMPPPASEDDVGNTSSSGSSGGSSGSWSGSSRGGGWNVSSKECTYGYDCVPSGDGTQTRILVFDITNRAAPVKLREIEATGSLLAARRIGHTVHTVLVNELGEIPGLKSYPTLPSMSCETEADQAAARNAAVQAWEDLRRENLAVIARTDLRERLPGLRENGGGSLRACDGFYRPAIAEGTTFTSVMSFDLTDPAAPKSATIVGDPGVVYASDASLYMSVPHVRAPKLDWYPGMDEDQASVVHQFAIGDRPGATSYLASGVVKGRVLDQFALDEHAAHLRIATTTGHAPSPETHSTMSILERRGSSLVLTGAVDHIAPSEDIRSVRFDGTRGFIVTFKKTDPLFAFDLSNPSAPVLTGEVQIPGFSTYIHMMDDTHLLTIGYDANDQGSFAWFAGVRLQIFDVSDMKNPVLLHAEVIGTRGSSSEALTNHLAFNYYAPKNILALPMTICEGGNGGSFGTNMTFSGLMVYDVTVTGGFHLRGRVAHPNTASGSGWDSGACSNWWTNASSEVKRSVVMDDFLYSISERRVKASSLQNPNVDLAEVSLENPGWSSPLTPPTFTGGGD